MTDPHDMLSWASLCFVTVLTGVKITDFQMPNKTSGTIKYLLDILRIHQTSRLGSRVQTSPTCLPAKMYYGNF